MERPKGYSPAELNNTGGNPNNCNYHELLGAKQPNSRVSLTKCCPARRGDNFPARRSNIILTDKDAGETGSRLHASYEGVLPDLFFNPHSEIILQGSYGPDRIFQTDDILVKCPSKYQSLEEEYSEQGPAQEYGAQDAAQSG